jgi:hypothetical protein
MKTLNTNTDRNKLTIVNSNSGNNTDTLKNESSFVQKGKIDAVYFIMMHDKKNSIYKHTCGLIPQNS